MAPSDIRSVPAEKPPAPPAPETTIDAATGLSAAEIADAVRAAFAGDKTAIWRALKRTNPKATKPFQRAGGFRGTQIDPAWRLQMMTEVFGPVGKGWGYEQLEWTIAERMVFICCRVWIADPATGEKLYTGPQWGGTEMVRTSRDGRERPDDECFKMSMTDAIGKCFLQLGLAADIYLGQFDDSKYREESETHYKAIEAGWTELARARFEKETKVKLEQVEDLDALDDLWSGGVNRDAREVGKYDKACKDRVIAAFAARKEAIEKAAAADPVARLRDAVDAAADPAALSSLFKANREWIDGLKADDPEAYAKVLALFQDRKKALAARGDGGTAPGRNDADPLPERPRTVEVPVAPDGEPAWGAFADHLLDIIPRVRSRRWGEAFLDIHKGQINRLAAVREIVGTFDGKEMSGTTVASAIRGRMQIHLDAIDPPRAAPEAAE